MVDLVRLPDHIERGSQGGPQFKVNILSAVSGHEQRDSKWDRRRGVWDVGYGIRNVADLQTVEALFHAQLGKTFPFLFKDWKDYTATDETIGTGNGVLTTFQLIKTYVTRKYTDNSVVRSYVRDIEYPVASTVVIKDNGSTVSPSNYTLNSGGVLVFNSAVTNGHLITWTGEFDVPVRFDIDELKVSVDSARHASARGIKIAEVLDE